MVCFVSVSIAAATPKPATVPARIVEGVLEDPGTPKPADECAVPDSRHPVDYASGIGVSMYFSLNTHSPSSSIIYSP
jgi:hypothetical protein